MFTMTEKVTDVICVFNNVNADNQRITVRRNTVDKIEEMKSLCKISFIGKDSPIVVTQSFDEVFDFLYAHKKSILK